MGLSLTGVSGTFRCQSVLNNKGKLNICGKMAEKKTAERKYSKVSFEERRREIIKSEKNSNQNYSLGVRQKINGLGNST